MVRWTLAAVFAAAVPAFAAPAAAPASFESALTGFEARSVARLAAERAIKAKSAADDLVVEARNVKALAQEAWQLRGLLADARRRAASPQRGGDLTLAADVNRLVYYLNAWASDCQQVDADLRRLATAVAKDPSLVDISRKLDRRAAALDSESGYLAIEAQAARFELAAAGYGGQAYYIQQDAQASAQFSIDIHAQARRILARVQ